MSLAVVRVDGVPAVTALKFRDGLQLGVGTSTGQVRLGGRWRAPTRKRLHTGKLNRPLIGGLNVLVMFVFLLFLLASIAMCLSM